MIKIAVKFGLICGLIAVLSSTIFYTLGLAFKSQSWINNIANLIVFVIIIALLVIAIKEYRRELKGIITFAQAFQTSLIAFVIIAIFSTIFNLILYNSIDKEYADKMKILAMEKAEQRLDKQMAKGRIDEVQKMEWLEAFESKDTSYTLQRALKNFGIVILVYAGISAILAAAIKKDVSDILVTESETEPES